MNRREIVRKLIVFNQVSLDGYFVDANADMSWAHKNDPEWTEFSSSNASGNGVLVFGRITHGQFLAIAHGRPNHASRR
jgi:dihydrofolate reductase